MGIREGVFDYSDRLLGTLDDKEWPKTVENLGEWLPTPALERLISYLQELPQNYGSLLQRARELRKLEGVAIWGITDECGDLDGVDWSRFLDELAAMAEDLHALMPNQADIDLKEQGAEVLNENMVDIEKLADAVADKVVAKTTMPPLKRKDQNVLETTEAFSFLSECGLEMEAQSFSNRLSETRGNSKKGPPLFRWLVDVAQANKKGPYTFRKNAIEALGRALKGVDDERAAQMASQHNKGMFDPAELHELVRSDRKNTR